jgi:hypothetical protein
MRNMAGSCSGSEKCMDETTLQRAKALCRSPAYVTGANWVVAWYLAAFRAHLRNAPAGHRIARSR